MARAALESVVFQVNDLLIAIREVTGETGVLSVDGGAAANSTLMQLQADLSGVSVLRPQAPDLSALGAAHLACLAARWWSLDGLDALPRPRAPVHARGRARTGGIVNVPRGVRRSSARAINPGVKTRKEGP